MLLPVLRKPHFIHTCSIINRGHIDETTKHSLCVKLVFCRRLVASFVWFGVQLVKNHVHSLIKSGVVIILDFFIAVMTLMMRYQVFFPGLYCAS